MLVEPALNPVWAWLVHGERVGAAALAGGALVLATTAAKALVDWRLYPSAAGAAIPAAARNAE
jgi:hypothetical protein